MKTAQKMGIKRSLFILQLIENAPHVKFADEAVWIGDHLQTSLIY
jgi:propionyl-CoA carboxylase alpha chain